MSVAAHAVQKEMSSNANHSMQANILNMKSGE